MRSATKALLDPDLHLVWSPYYLEPRIRDEAIAGQISVDYEDEGTIPLPQARRMALAMRGNGDTDAFTM
jgi:hypothetical protein